MTALLTVRTGEITLAEEPVAATMVAVTMELTVALRLAILVITPPPPAQIPF